jgi:hypothetical protein
VTARGRPQRTRGWPWRTQNRPRGTRGWPWRTQNRPWETRGGFAFSYIMVTRIRDGQIVSSRDYFNPLDSAAALGRAPELLASVLGQAS